MEFLLRKFPSLLKVENFSKFQMGLVKNKLWPHPQRKEQLESINQIHTRSRTYYFTKDL